MAWRRMDSLKQASRFGIAAPLSSYYLKTVKDAKERTEKKKKESFASQRLSSIQRNEDLLVAAIDSLPEAPPVWGIYGKGWNLVKEAPELFVGASSFAFNMKAQLLAADAYLSTLEV